MNFINKKLNKPKIFFIGIGGISMSALAKYFSLNGYYVGGSDKFMSETTVSLQNNGITVYISHNKNNVINYDVVVYNSAIDDNNVELIEAKKLKKIVIKRIELLQILIKSYPLSVGVCGCHGKTSVTTQLAHIFKAENIGFTAHIGGNTCTFGNMYQCGTELFLTEVCEFQKNINLITTDYAIALNIDNDHMDSYSSIDNLIETFYAYLDRAKYKCINTDNKYLCAYANADITFGLNSNAEYSYKILSNIKNKAKIRILYKGKKQFDIKTCIIGQHGINNMLASVALSKLMGITDKSIINGIKDNKGVERRNELLGSINSAKVFADYAHHPNELLASISAYKKMCKRLIVVFQPHTFSRTKNLLDEFENVLSNVSDLFIYKTYAARETENDGVSALNLSNKLNNSVYFDDFNKMYYDIVNKLSKNSLLLILGAGDLYNLFKEKLKNAFLY